MSSNRHGSMEQASSGIRQAANSASELATDAAQSVNAKLRTVGVDTDAIMDSAKDQAGEFQKMIAAEVRKRPFYALAAAALFGMWLGHRS